MKRRLPTDKLIIAAALVLAGLWSVMRFQSKPVTHGSTSKATDQIDLAAEFPKWLPIYPGATVTRVSSKHTPYEQWFEGAMNAHGDCKEAADWYQKKFEAQGFKMGLRTDDNLQGCDSIFTCENAAQKRSVRLSTYGGARGLSIGMTTDDREGPGTTVRLPKWVPVYPGAVVDDVEAERRANEADYRFQYSFEHADAPKVVFAWYETQLKQAGFKATAELSSTTVSDFHAKTADERRQLNIRSSPTHPHPTYIVEAVVK